MKERLRLSLGGLWLATSLVSLILPVFLLTSANPQSFLQNVIGTAMVTMFILSFPSSLFGIPLLYISQIVLGVDPNSIGGMYLNLFLLFVLGLVQWFWIFPRLWRSESDIQTLNLPIMSEPPLLEIGQNDIPIFNRDTRTPLERVIQDD